MLFFFLQHLVPFYYKSSCVLQLLMYHYLSWEQMQQQKCFLSMAFCYMTFYAMLSKKINAVDFFACLHNIIGMHRISAGGSYLHVRDILFKETPVCLKGRVFAFSPGIVPTFLRAHVVRIQIVLTFTNWGQAKTGLLL